MKANKHEINGYIYVTSEEILIGKNVFDKHRKEILFCENKENLDFFKLTPTRYFGIILCNNPNLSIQQLTTEEVEYLKVVDSFEVKLVPDRYGRGEDYKIIIPQETEQTKESIEEVAERFLSKELLDLSDWDKRHILKAMVNMSKWQQEQDKNKFNEKDMKQAFNVGFQTGYTDETSPSYLTAEKFIEQFKKK